MSFETHEAHETLKTYNKNFKHYDLREHVYERPGTYIGSSAKIIRSELVYDIDKDLLVRKEITLPEGVENLFMELLTNASDNILRCQEEKIPFKNITINLTSTSVEVVNNGGLTIPIELIETNKGFSGYKPELIFGVLLTSSDNDDDKNEDFVKVEAGQNGLGSKLCNVFSTLFEVEICDHINKKLYKQKWEDRMQIKNKPIIKTSRKNTPHVKVKHYLDFAKFDYESYPIEAIELFISKAIGVSFSCNCKIVVNLSINDDSELGIIEKTLKFNELSLPNFCNLINPDCNKVFYYKYKPSTNDKKSLITFSSNKKIPKENLEVELCVLDTIDNGFNYSYANGIFTKNGGVHVWEATDKIPRQIMNMIKEKSNKNFNISMIKPHLSIVISVHVNDPKFSNQYKNELTSPYIPIDVELGKIKKLLNWGFSQVLNDRIKKNKLKELKKTDGVQKKHISIGKLQDANFAGRKGKSELTTLFISEGDSAKSFLTGLISNLEGGRDLHGCYPLKGKFLNIIKATENKINANNEFIEIKQILGLKECVDYNIEKNSSTLRYGKVIIVADADVDGKHIVGLMLTLFYKKYPSLLKREYFSYMRTPIVKVMKGKLCNKFYTIQDYDKWCHSTQGYDKWHAKYFKGLGTSTEKDIIEESKNPKYVKLYVDDLTDEVMNSAFGKNADVRKKWLREMGDLENIPDVDRMSISFFLNREVGEYSSKNIIRMIPDIFDGFKPSQRKCIWASMNKWNPTIGKNFTAKDEFKLCRLANYIAEYTQYLNGEDSLNGALISMAQDIIGSNNMNVFAPKGRFGTRNENGKDASQARYLFTHPEWWWSYIFRKEDKPLLKLIEEEGELCEPEHFYPIIPFLLVNGSSGMASGWSTNIANHNPVDICNWLIVKINNELNINKVDQKFPKVNPWYKGFKGDIITEDDVDNIIEDNINIDTEKFIDKCLDNSVNSKSVNTNKVLIRGIFKVLSKKNVKGEDRYNILVTELPVGGKNKGISIVDYVFKLEKLIKDEKIIDFDNNCTDSEINITIKGYVGEVNHKSLYLETTDSLNNFHINYNNYNVPIKIDSIENYLNLFYELRYPIYDDRKRIMIINYEKEKEIINEKIRFINAVRNEEINLRDVNEINHVKMQKINVSIDLLKTTTANMFGDNKVSKLEKQQQDVIEKIDFVKNTPSKVYWLNEIEEFLNEYIKRN